MPYPPSKDLIGWQFKSGCNPGYGSGNVKGASADTFFPSWAGDGNLYTGFTVREHGHHAAVPPLHLRVFIPGAARDARRRVWRGGRFLSQDGHVLDDETKGSSSAKSEGSAPLYQVTHGQAVIVGDDPFALNITKVKTFSNQSGKSSIGTSSLSKGYRAICRSCSFLEGDSILRDCVLVYLCCLCVRSAWPYGGRFPGGQLVYKGTWWYSTYYVPQYPKGPSSGPNNVLHGGLLGPLADFRHSLDLGETWIEPLANATSDSDNLFGEVGDDPLHGKPNTLPARIKFGTPHWVDFGQELEHSPDGKAYLVAHGAVAPGSTEMWMLGDQVYLARVTPTVANIGDKTKWEFYAGGHGSAARWVSGDVSKATPLLEFTNHTGSTTMTYFAAIKKFVITINTASNYPVMDGGDFDTWMLEVRCSLSCQPSQCPKVTRWSLSEHALGCVDRLTTSRGRGV
jgi:hypothetical protein